MGSRVLLRIFVIISFFITPALAASAPVTPIVPKQVKPADEGPQDPSFAAYRKALLGAISRKDINAVTKLMDAHVKCDFGGGEGIAAFRKSWNVTSPDTYVWKALELVVANGGHFNSRTQFAAPYVYSAWPDDVDAFENVVITDPSAVLLEGQKPGSRIIRKLGFEIVEVIEGAGKPQHETGEGDWSNVRTQDGLRGYVRAGQYRSPIDYRAIFEKRKGRWRMTVFIAGD